MDLDVRSELIAVLQDSNAGLDTIVIVSEAITVDAKFQIWFVDVAKKRARADNLIDIVETSEQLARECCTATRQFQIDHDRDKLNVSIRNFIQRCLELTTRIDVSG
jgi:hypothetical protein